MTLPILKAGGPYTMAINDIELKDILIGDVWVCSGQSNMELPVSRVTDRFRDEISTDSNYPMVRYIKHLCSIISCSAGRYSGNFLASDDS